MNKQTGNNRAGVRERLRGGLKGPGPGRPKGSENRFTRDIKDAIKLAFDRVGGVDALTAWARKNRTEFYKLTARLIPHEVTGAFGAPLVPSTVQHEHTGTVSHHVTDLAKLSDAELAELYVEDLRKSSPRVADKGNDEQTH